MGHSIVEFMPDRSGHSCGYCKSSDGSLSDGMWAYAMTVQDYQDLIDRGWRRSGMYCYKPIMTTTCCPAYTIRCEALDVRLSKSQKKILKRMRKFLIDGQKSTSDYESSKIEDDNICDADKLRLENIKQPSTEIDINKVDFSEVEKSHCKDSEEITSVMNSDTRKMICEEEPSLENNSSPTNQKKINNSGKDIGKPLMKKAKLIRLERREKKLQAKLNSQESNQSLIQTNSNKKTNNNEAKTIEQFLFESLPENRKHNLEIKLVKSESPDLNMKLTWELYAKYQIIIHKDKPTECDMSSFKEFLVNTPLKFEKNEDGPECGYGSFHQQYWLDNKLIAVGVIDILPYCISSVYFFYDPDYSFLSLGTYSSLREIAAVRSLNSNAALLKYYYMGFYIHSCPKMRYKGKITPSYLLCPEIYSWHPIESCVPKLDSSKYSRLNEDINAESKDSNVDLNRVLILWKNVTVDYNRYKRLSKKQINSEHIQYYAKLVGRTLSQRILLYQ